MSDSAHFRRSRLLHNLTIVVAIILTVLCVTYLTFATEWGVHGHVFDVLLGSAVAVALGTLVVRGRDSVISGSLLVIGVLAVLWGSGLPEHLCLQGSTGDVGTLLYEWQQNVLRFDSPRGSSPLACHTDPNRPVWLGGLFLIAGGVVGLIRGWSWPSDRNALVRMLPSSVDLSAGDWRRTLFGFLAAAALSAFYLVGQGTWHGALSWLPLTVLLAWGIGALVTERRIALAGAIVATLGLAVLRVASLTRCEELAAVTTPATGLTVRPGALAVRYAWTGTTDVPFGQQIGSLACHTDFAIPEILLGVALVAVGIVLTLHDRG